MRAARGQPATQSQPKRQALLAQLAGPLRGFLATEAGSAGLLLAATSAALVWANSPWSEAYTALWHTELAVRVGDRALTMDLLHWLNDGLMVIFFFVIGLEVRHELSVGELKERRRVIVPFLGAVGGLVVPALLYLAVNPTGEAAQGWGIVIGTDTAFLLGALALVGPLFSTQLRVFLLTMTIADDLLAVSVIGVVYTDSIDLIALAVAVAALGAIALLGRLRVWRTSAYALAGFVLWLATVASGVHPSIAGMAAGLLIASYLPRLEEVDRATRLFRAFRQSPLPRVGYSAKLGLQRAVSVNERLQVDLHPWTSFVIVPLFAFANAGVDLRGGLLEAALRSPVTWGVVLGLGLGKPIGIGLAVLGAVRFRLGRLPQGVGPGQALGGAALSGIGFTVSLLIVGLAFDTPALRQEATIGVLLAAGLSVLTGWITFRLAAMFLGERTASLPMFLDRPVEVSRDHVRGPVNAPLTLVEYSDFECAFCGAATNVVRELRERFGNELRYVFRHLPLADIHEHAELAAQAAEAADAQHRFWEMHDLLFQHQRELELEDLIGYAAMLELDVEEFTRTLTEGRAAERVREDVASAEASGARGTPTFFVGNRRHVGPYDTESLTRAIQAARSAAVATGREKS